MKPEFRQLRQIIERCRTFVLTTHVSPDCDGLGSEVALAAYLHDLGKSVSIINYSETPEPYRFLDPSGTIERYDKDRHEKLLRTADAIVVLDTNQPERLVDMAEPVRTSSATKIVIDHHLDADPFADLLIIDDTSAATGEILFRILEGLNGPVLPKPTAQALYIAIMTDTGSFRFPKTDAELHRIIAKLIDSGADPVSAYQTVYEQDSLPRVRLLGKVLAGVQTAHRGKVAYLTIPASLFRETGTGEPDVERFAPYALQIKGVLIGLMFTELKDQIKISFRSKGEIPINKLAQEFGGNGHKNAAGARISDKALDQLIQDVVNRSKHYLPS